MNDQKKKTVFLVQSALIAAIYAAATYLSAAFGIAYGSIQFRLSEAFTVLAVLTPAAVPGLSVGCVLGNLSSPMGIWDILFGTAATLVSALAARKLAKVKIKSIPLVSILIPAVLNALIVGAELTFLMPGNRSRAAIFAVNAAEIFIGEAVVCIAGGIPVYLGMKKTVFRGN